MTASWRDTVAAHQTVIAAMSELGPQVETIVETILACLRGGGRVYTLGNGGSAADAQHIAAELLGRFKLDRAALPAMALTTDSSTLTAVGNDLGYEQVFARQVAGLARPGDIVWLLSTSGTSPNVLAALAAARAARAVTIGFTGQSGGELAGRCDHLLCVPHAASERIQEGHILAYHYICGRVEAEMAGPNAGRGTG